MTAKKQILLLYVLIFLEFIILYNSKAVVLSVLNSTKLFVNNIFPSLFPTMVLGLLLTKLNFYQIIPSFIKTFFRKLFNFSDIHTSIFLSSMICGSPSSSLFINESLKKQLITKKEAESLFCCTIFINPLFVINVVGNIIFNSYKAGILLLLLTYLLNLIKAYFLRKNFSIYKKSNIITKNKKIINELINSIKESVLSSINIFGFIIVFNLLIALVSEIINNKYIVTLFSVLTEVTSGLLKLNTLNIDISLKFIICLISLCFGGICILMQSYSLLNKEY